MIFLDSETVGFHGLAVLIQWAKDDGPIHLHEVFRVPFQDTLELIEEICEDDVVGFNLAFDWFHMVKLVTLFRLFIDKGGDPQALPEDHIEELAILEEQARDSEYTCKPKRACDLMLHARRGPYQTLMGRSDIKVKNVPGALSEYLRDELNKRIKLDEIYFAAKKGGRSTERWQVCDRPGTHEFKDVVLKFKASGALKTLAQHALKVDKSKILRMADVEIDRTWLPIEYGFAPYALAISTPEKQWKGKIKKKSAWITGYAWPGVIRKHIAHWAFYSLARQYAEDDVTYTRDLWKFFGSPEPGDNDSELACAVGCVRWRGYKIDLDRIRAERDIAIAKIKNTPTSAAVARKYIIEPMNEIERLGFGTATAKAILEKFVEDPNWFCDCTEETKHADPNCKLCNGLGLHPAQARTREVLDARFAKKEVELYDKILIAGRLHASFIVIGALSSRMSGTDGLNPQGVKRTKNVRRCFQMAYDGFELWGGDFDAFEVVIADAAYDGALNADLTTLYDCYECKTTGKTPAKGCKECKKTGLYLGKPCQGCNGTGTIPECACEDCGGSGRAPKKIHGLFAMELYDKTYEEVMATKGNVPDLYSLGKNGIFTMIYGGDWGTLVRKYKVPEENAQKAFKTFIGKRPGIKRGQQRIYDGFCSMRQPGGIGTKVEWHTPDDYVESLFGFRRFFTLENRICGELFDLANKPPKHWKDIKIKCTRRADRGIQTVGGATASALYGAAFGIQSSNMRAATNHVIQSSGATVTKAVQRAIWDVQPHGIHKIRVLPCNIHDEILCPTKPEYVEPVRQAVYKTVEAYRPRIPLVKFEFKKMRSWAEK